MRRFSIASIFLLAVTLACSMSAQNLPAVAGAKPTQEKILAAAPPVEITAQVTAYQSLHVRVRPGEHSPLAKPGYLYHADPVTLTGTCQTGWAEIAWHGGTAWVNASFLSDNKCQTSEEE
jgi:uncharacterized protein YgiM (DUF1202 family)